MIRLPTVLVTTTADGTKHRFVSLKTFVQTAVGSFILGISAGGLVAFFGFASGVLAR